MSSVGIIVSTLDGSYCVYVTLRATLLFLFTLTITSLLAKEKADNGNETDNVTKSRAAHAPQSLSRSVCGYLCTHITS
jgi:hypothetical protein